MKQGKALTAERLAEITAHEIDLSDIPELTKEQWEQGHFRNQAPISVVIDFDNAAWLKKNGNAINEYTVNNILRWARRNGCPAVDPAMV